MVGFLPSLSVRSLGSMARGTGSRAGIAAEPFAAISALVPGLDSPGFNLNLPSLPFQLL